MPSISSPGRKQANSAVEMAWVPLKSCKRTNAASAPYYSAINNQSVVNINANWNMLHTQSIVKTSKPSNLRRYYLIFLFQCPHAHSHWHREMHWHLPVLACRDLESSSVTSLFSNRSHKTYAERKSAIWDERNEMLVHQANRVFDEWITNLWRKCMDASVIRDSTSSTSDDWRCNDEWKLVNLRTKADAFHWHIVHISTK